MVGVVSSIQNMRMIERKIRRKVIQHTAVLTGRKHRLGMLGVHSVPAQGSLGRMVWVSMVGVGWAG